MTSVANHIPEHSKLPNLLDFETVYKCVNGYHASYVARNLRVDIVQTAADGAIDC